MISVILCTYNPDKAIIERVLAHLAQQTLPQDRWELLLVDSVSTNSVPAGLDLSCFRNGRLITMKEPGLTPARAAGGKAAKGELLVFVDDDNLVAPDYLDQCGKLAEEFPGIGVFSASIEAELEAPASLPMAPYWSYLAVRPLERDYWANVPAPHVWPIGAGMGVRRAVMEHYLDSLARDPRRKKFDRIGQSLEASGDSDIGAASFDLGMGCGAFRALQLKHVIRKHRLEPQYLGRLVRSVSRSGVRFQQMLSGPEVGLNDFAKLGVRFLRALKLPRDTQERQVAFASLKGHAEALWSLWRAR